MKVEASAPAAAADSAAGFRRRLRDLLLVIFGGLRLKALALHSADTIIADALAARYSECPATLGGGGGSAANDGGRLQPIGELWDEHVDVRDALLQVRPAPDQDSSLGRGPALPAR